MRIYLIFLLSFFFLYPFWLSCELVDRIAVVVNDEAITLSELLRSIKIKKEGKFVSVEEYFIGKKIKENLEPFIEDILIRQQAKKMGIEVQEREVDRVIEEIKKQSLISEKELMEHLKRQKISYNDFREGIRLNLLRNKVLGGFVSVNLSITEETLSRYYEAHKDEFRENEFWLKQIFISHQIEDAQRLAQEAFQRLKEGSKFEDVALLFSQRQEASDIGFVKEKELLPEIREALRGLKEGMYSNIVITPYGFHIIKVEEIKKGKILPLEEVKEEIRQRIIKEESKRQYKEFIEKLKKEAYIEVRI